MNNEIKEILENIKNKYEDYYVQDVVSGSDLKQLLDYITNLETIEQQYSAILSENTELEIKITNLEQERDKYKRYIDETFLYSYEELQDKVLKLQQEYNELSKKLWNEVDDRIKLKEKNDKANWWLEQMLKQAKSEETKAIINGALELLLTGGDEE